MTEKYKRPFAPEATLTEEELEENTPAVPDAQLTAEEKTWKKRYGDLRSHTQKQINDLNSKLESLTNQLRDSANNQLQLPTSPDEVAAWAAKYPQVAAIVETIAMTKAKQMNEGVEARLNDIRERERKTAAESAVIELKKIHPDFDQLKDNEAFFTWLNSKSKKTQDSILENETDYQAAAETISLFKLETGFGKPQTRRPSNRDNASEVRSKATTMPSNGIDPVFKESQIRNMNSRQFEENLEAIEKAQREGRIEYDLTDSKEAARA